MVYNRRNRADYDELERLGNKGWGWSDILPVFKAFENNEFGPSPTRGTGGPLNISVLRDADPLDTEMMAAATRIGLTAMDDVNESDKQRIGYAPSTIKNGRRVRAADAFLKPARHRPNLTVKTKTKTTAQRIIFEHRRAVGVEVTGAGGIAELRATREVIVALGSLSSPKLLQLSGIGPRDVLESAGVQVYLQRDNVGRRMREHRCLAIKFRLNADLGYNRQLSSTSAQAITTARYLATRRGPLATPVFDLLAFLKTSPDLDRVYGQVLLGPFTIPAYNTGEPTGFEREPGISCLGSVLRPTSQGTVSISAAHPGAPIVIEPNYLTSAYDRKTGANVLRKMREIFAQSPIAERVSQEMFPGGEDVVDSQLKMRVPTTFESSTAQ